MIRILRDGTQVAEATKYLEEKNLPSHPGIVKNWDLWQIAEIMQPRNRNAPILDVGCWLLAVPRLLGKMRFRRIWGIDKYPKRKIFRRERSLLSPARILRGDFLQNRFRDGFFRVVTCVSVIEHGVDPDRFFAQVSRILKPEGLLFLTTDYWSKKIKVFGGPDDPEWAVFSRAELKNIIRIADSHGLKLYQNMEIPRIGKPVIHFKNSDYTFISLLFVQK